jgi:hypothetical protein
MHKLTYPQTKKETPLGVSLVLTLGLTRPWGEPLRGGR